MLFNSFIFFIFLAIVLPAFYLSGKKYRNLILLASSYFFYGYWDWRFCFLLVLSTVVDFFIGKRLHAEEREVWRKRLLLISVSVNLGILAFFKYFNFFVASFEEMLTGAGMTADFVHLNIILPVGISFYTFQTMSYTIDIYRKKLEPTHNFFDFALFVSFFPQLVAGPIERASSLLPQITRGLSPNPQQIREGVHLIIVGMFKKVMIGDACGRIVDHIFAQPEYYASIELFAALLLFAIQIYADFSGYSSIARGTSKLLGIELMKNFEQPYLSANITEFWRRWHISLSSWLKDYLYIPLGGNRKGTVRTYINLMLTMLLGGLWHGANWTFVVWGGLHGSYLAIHKLMLRGKKPQTRYVHTSWGGLIVYAGKVVAVFLLVLLTWLFFRAQSFEQAAYFLHKFVYWEYSALSGRFITIALGFLAMSTLIDILQYNSRAHTFLLRVSNPPVRWAVLSALMLISVIYMFVEEPLPFVYFQF